MNKKASITCSENAVDLEKVNQTLQSLPEFQKTKSIASLFKTLADPTRLVILQSLAVSEHCVCNLSAILNLSVSATSHQLRNLRDNDFVDYRKEGKMVYYSLKDTHILQLLSIADEHTVESP